MTNGRLTKLKQKLIDNKISKMTDTQRLLFDLRSLGVKREELAYRFGLSYATIARWERGNSEPRASEFKLLKSFRDQKYASESKCKGVAERA